MNKIKSISKILPILIIGAIGVQTIGCSSDGDNSGDGTGGSTISCQTDNVCVNVSAEACLDLQGWKVPSCGVSSPSGSSSSVVASGSCNISDYRTVTIGTQTWMAENYNCHVEGSKCYNNENSNCVKYGRLYDWATAMSLPNSYNSNFYSDAQTRRRGICPSGGHIPGGDEWITLRNYVGSNVGSKLRTVGGWDSNNNGTDNYDFSALPGGQGDSYGDFKYVGSDGYWWSASEESSSNAFCFGIYTSNDLSTLNCYKPTMFSIRCVKDN